MSLISLCIHSNLLYLLYKQL